MDLKPGTTVVSVISAQEIGLNVDKCGWVKEKWKGWVGMLA